MNRAIIIFAILSLQVESHANEISWPFLHASDYYRGTAGERIMFTPLGNKVGKLYIFNDYRFYNFKSYFDIHNDEQEVYGYLRSLNLFSINYSPIQNLCLSVRIPLVYAKSNWNRRSSYTNAGLSDIFLGVSYRLLRINNNNIYLSTGLKFPTGMNYKNTRKVPISTGSYDIPLIINSDIVFDYMINHLDVGIIFNGDSRDYPYDYTGAGKNGKEIFIDWAISKKVSKFNLISEFNYFYIFDLSESHAEIRYDGGNYSLVEVLNDRKYKLSIVPGILAELNSNMMIEIGYSIDLLGRDVYSGNSIVFRLYYKIA